jgi:hypothetical protein
MAHHGYSNEDLHAIHTLEDEGGASFPLANTEPNILEEEPTRNILLRFSHAFIEMIKKLRLRKPTR